MEVKESFNASVKVNAQLTSVSALKNGRICTSACHRNSKCCANNDQITSLGGGGGKVGGE